MDLQLLLDGGQKLLPLARGFVGRLLQLVEKASNPLVVLLEQPDRVLLNLTAWLLVPLAPQVSKTRAV